MRERYDAAMARHLLIDALHITMLVIGALGLVWVGMMAIHELGHVLGAMATGGRVVRVVLPVLGFSRTDISPNPSPGIVVWMGPLVGTALPVLTWLSMQRARRLERPTAFFAGFCLLANGAYIAFGSIDKVGDCGVMLQTGTPPWVLWTFGGLAMTAGFAVWHTMGPMLGITTRVARHWGWLMLLAWVLIAALLTLAAR